MAGYIGSKALVVSNGAERKKVFNITTPISSLTGCIYTPSQVHVFHNGVRLVDGTDYTATDGSTVTLTTAAQSGDEVVVISYATFQASDAVSATMGGTFRDSVKIGADGTTALTVDRSTSDGMIVNLQKDGSSVGILGTANSGDLYVGSGDAGLMFSGNSDAVLPFDPATGLGRDASIDLAIPVTRFRDLYLSGGVYLGGTGAANFFDDYEVGTWTPVSVGTSVTISPTHARYTKIGNYIIANAKTTISTNSDSNATKISLPLAVGLSTADGGFVRYSDSGINNLYITASPAQAELAVYDSAGNVLPFSSLSGKRFDFTVIYKGN